MSFNGRLDRDDSVNGDDNAGSAAASAITDWSAFETPYRLWGPDAEGPIDPVADARCDTGTCRIWDWRFIAGDEVVRNFNGVLQAGTTCPASVHGDVVLDNIQTPGGAFLVNAVEIIDDAQGDDDGLCETDEACIYSPHIGAYQGEGEANVPCTFEDGVVSGVTMFGRAIP
ncbi:MAG: hypothetical protein JRH20_29395 [Deltaproteobacteria bacterium]|nr:hypothetical protein [Deltaproteobacteria bacterium]